MALQCYVAILSILAFLSYGHNLFDANQKWSKNKYYIKLVYIDY